MRLQPQPFLTLFLIISSLLFPALAPAKVIFVAQDAPGDRSGSSWENACTTITAGLASSASGDEIWVSCAVYREAIEMKEGVALYGGFVGTEIVRQQRNWIANPCTVDAGGKKTHAVIGSNNAILDGFGVTGGESDYGGGVYCKDVSMTIAHCRIVENRAIERVKSAYASAYGGGIYFTGSTCDLVITDCQIVRNEVIADANNDQGDGKTYIDARGEGGGIYANGRSVQITKCSISENSLLVHARGRTLQGTYATAQGGGIWCTHANIDSSTIAKNTLLSLAPLDPQVGPPVENTGEGGGLYAVGPQLTNCVIARNSAHTFHAYMPDYPYASSGVGGGLYGSGGTLVNCTIVGNISAGKISNASGDVIYTTGVGGGLYGNRLVYLKNCILWGNISNQLSGNARCFSSDISGGWTGTNNINADPLFANALDNDYHLQNRSPCIDRGFVSDAPNTDIEGNQRPGIDNLVDMGAYESPSEYEPEPMPLAMIYHVRQVGAATADGLTWETALNSIQVAINLASASDEIWVASGTYHEAILPRWRSRLYGGFTGTETSLEERDWHENETIIDAAGHDTHAVTILVHDVLLDGFTICGGNAQKGGGIYCGQFAPQITNCVIRDNLARLRGGGFYGSISSAAIEHCTLAGNQANDSGGGLCLENKSYVRLDSCIVIGNRAVQGGGGAHINESSPRITRCRFIGNSSTKYRGGGIYIDFANPRITNCIVRGNSAKTFGGGIRIFRGKPTITACTITDNTAEEGSQISLSGAFSAPVTNCIVWNSGVAETRVIKGGEAVITNCCVKGGWPGQSNINADPLFVDPAGGDYHLQNYSPCIDRGLVSAAPETDIDGNPRPGGDSKVDMGAYESRDEYVPIANHGQYNTPNFFLYSTYWQHDERGSPLPPAYTEDDFRLLDSYPDRAINWRDLYESMQVRRRYREVSGVE